MEELTFQEIKTKIQSITIELASYVNIEEHNYTHQPSKESIVSEIDSCIYELTNLRNILNNE